jgi:hypothetical protein
MTAEPARHPRRSLERRRRERHYRLRRRDLLQDTLIAVALAFIVLTTSAGLGVVAILVFATGGVLVATIAAERALKRKRANVSATTWRREEPARSRIAADIGTARSRQVARRGHGERSGEARC